MEISDIKQKLSILEVVLHYNLQPNKHNLLCCPFHKDKTPSLQLYPNTNTYNCFGCGKTGDQIQFIQDFEKLDKYTAIMKAKTLINPAYMEDPQTYNTKSSTRIAVITKAFKYFVQGAKSYSPQLKDYLKSRNLDPLKIEIGYNSGQFHHRQSMELVNSYAKYNLLLPGKSVSNEGKGFIPWAKHCIIFALKDKQDHVTSLYGRSILDKEESKHFYLKDRQGLYPHYPNAATEKLILTEAVIDAATLLQLKVESEKLKDYVGNI